MGSSTCHDRAINSCAGQTCPRRFNAGQQVRHRRRSGAVVGVAVPRVPAHPLLPCGVFGDCSLRTAPGFTRGTGAVRGVATACEMAAASVTAEDVPQRTGSSAHASKGRQIRRPTKLSVWGFGAGPFCPTPLFLMRMKPRRRAYHGFSRGLQPRGKGEASGRGRRLGAVCVRR